MAETHRGKVTRAKKAALVLGDLDERVRRVFLYGSVANREDTRNSDIDLCVVTSEELTYTEEMGLGRKLEVKINCNVGRGPGNLHLKFASEEDLRCRDNDFFGAVKREGRDLSV